MRRADEGFYRKVTSFTDPQLAQYCTYFYCGIVTQNVVVGHFSSNQGGWSIGGGLQHRFAGLERRWQDEDLCRGALSRRADARR